MLWHIQSSGHFYDPGEETVIYYDPSSGDTHLLTDLAAFVVEQIQAAPTSEQDLLERLRPHLDDEGVDVEALLTGVLQDLRILDIAQPQ